MFHRFTLFCQDANSLDGSHWLHKIGLAFFIMVVRKHFTASILSGAKIQHAAISSWRFIQERHLAVYLPLMLILLIHVQLQQSFHVIFMFIVLSSLLNCHFHFTSPSIPFLFHFHSHILSFFAFILISFLCSAISLHARFHGICLKTYLGYSKKEFASLKHMA